MPLRHPFLSKASLLRQPIYIRTALFHTTPIWRSEAPNFYETLGLDPSASAGDIKKYALPPILLAFEY